LFPFDPAVNDPKDKKPEKHKPNQKTCQKCD